MKNNDKISLFQWAMLIPYFETFVLLFLILLLWLQKHSKASAETQMTAKSRSKQSECYYDCISILCNLFSCYSHSAFIAISLQFSVYFSTPNKLKLMKTSVHFNLKCEEAKARKLHLSWYRWNEKHFWALSSNEMPWPQSKLAPRCEQRTALHLGFCKENKQNKTKS